MAPHPVDIHVGKKLRMRRMTLGMTQEDLGQAVGVTFQQVQKYERGLNRIGSSRLYRFSRILNVPVGYFFEDVEEESPARAAGMAEDADAFQQEKISNEEMLVLVRAYSGIRDQQVRKQVLSLMKSLSASASNAEENKAQLETVSS